MKEIKEVVSRIRKELKAAEWYASESAKDAEMYPALARHYIDMAEDNLRRVDTLHDAVSEMIHTAKDSGKQIPSGMMDVWEIEHEMLIEDADEIKRMISMHK